MSAPLRPIALALGLLLLLEPACRPPGRRQSTRPPRSMERTLIGATWDDPMRCAAAVGAGALLPRASFRLRLLSWTLGWFPDGSPGEPRGDGNNVDWLACVLTWLDVDVVALERVKLTPAGQRAMAALVAKLNESTRANWRFETDGCPGSRRAHAVILWRTDRVQVSLAASHPELDVSPHSDVDHPDCPGELTPALGAYVKSTSGGLGFHLLTFELEAEESPLGVKRRQEAWRQLAGIVKARQNLRPDTDVVIAAAFNSVGGRGPELRTPMAEREALTRALTALDPPLALVEPADTCTEYAKDEARETDYMVVSASMEEAQGLTPRSLGLCGALHCQSIDPNAYLALRQLSTHCPLLFDLSDRDDD
jgi:hypothetical protein